jgi:HAD superfamily hydrolase (TIGR01509 family)
LVRNALGSGYRADLRAVFIIKSILEPLSTSPIGLVIFDCDGVLVDSEVLSKRVLLRKLAELGANVSSDYFDTHFLGHSYEHVTAKVLDDFSVVLPKEFRHDYQHSLMQTFSAELTSTTELEHVLSRLAVPFCVATSSSPERVKHALNVTGLTEYFKDCVFTCSEVKKGKPAPDIFLHAAAKMGLAAKNCLVIEDSLAGIQAAQAANMQVIQYTGASHFSNHHAATKKKLQKVLHEVTTISHWKQLFELAPSLSSPL